jgi:flagellar hook-basal body complex protein FliE
LVLLDNTYHITAVSETEVAVEALVSVRDKMIQAYEEIMRMPI